MDYGALIRRSWEIVWNNKWLILLGVLVALGSGGGGGGNGGGGGSNVNFPSDNGNFNTNDNFNVNPSDVSPEALAGLGALMGLGIGVGIALLCVFVIIGVIFAVISRIATGGLIYAVNTIESGGTTTFGQSWGAGWKRGWTLIGNAIISALPGLVFALIIVILVATTVGFGTTLDEDAIGAAFGGMAVALIALTCFFIPLFILFNMLLVLADRAAMIEGLGVIESYSRAWEIVRNNFGQVLVVAIIYIVISFGLGLLLLGPTFAILVCFCLLWPLLWLINGALQAYFSTLWTLAYRQWSGRGSSPLTGPAADVSPPAPAV